MKRTPKKPAAEIAGVEEIAKEVAAAPAPAPKRKASTPIVLDDDADDDPVVAAKAAPQAMVTAGPLWSWGAKVGTGTSFCRTGSDRTWVCTHELGTGDFGSVYAVQCGASVGALKLFDHSHGLQKKKLEQAIDKARISSHDELYRYKQVAGISGFPSLLDPLPANIQLFAKDPFTGWVEPGFFVRHPE